MIGGTGVSALAHEINILDGAIIDTDELNLLKDRTDTLLDLDNVATLLTSWDTTVSDDLTVYTTFLGDVTGLYDNLQIGPSTVGNNELVRSLSYTGTLDLAGVWMIGGTQITANAYEINLLDGRSGTLLDTDNADDLLVNLLATWDTTASDDLIGSGTINYIPIWTGAGEFGTSVIYQSASKIGIGTTAPETVLSLGDTSYSFVAGGISFGDMDTGIYEVADDILAFRMAGTDALYINSNGYIGIGTSSPTAALEIAGSGGSSTISNTDGDLIMDPAQNLVINSGNVGIGTSDIINTLHVLGGAYISSGITTSSIQLTSNTAANSILVSDANGNASWTIPSSFLISVLTS
jgi:hypothetical protein